MDACPEMCLTSTPGSFRIASCARAQMSRPVMCENATPISVPIPTRERNTSAAPASKYVERDTESGLRQSPAAVASRPSREHQDGGAMQEGPCIRDFRQDVRTDHRENVVFVRLTVLRRLPALRQHQTQDVCDRSPTSNPSSSRRSPRTKVTRCQTRLVTFTTGPTCQPLFRSVVTYVS